MLPVLKGALQELHPQADAQDGLACGSGLQYRLRHAGGPQPGRRVAESPTPGRITWLAARRTARSPVTTASRPMAARGALEENRLPTP